MKEKIEKPSRKDLTEKDKDKIRKFYELFEILPYETKMVICINLQTIINQIDNQI